MKSSGSTLLAHCVGAGKTYVVAAAMKLKRDSIAKKSLIAIPHHLLEQFAGEFQKLSQRPAAHGLQRGHR